MMSQFTIMKPFHILPPILFFAIFDGKILGCPNNCQVGYWTMWSPCPLSLNLRCGSNGFVSRRTRRFLIPYKQCKRPDCPHLEETRYCGFCKNGGTPWKDGTCLCLSGYMGSCCDKCKFGSLKSLSFWSCYCKSTKNLVRNSRPRTKDGPFTQTEFGHYQNGLKVSTLESINEFIIWITRSLLPPKLDEYLPDFWLDSPTFQRYKKNPKQHKTLSINWQMYERFF